MNKPGQSPRQKAAPELPAKLCCPVCGHWYDDGKIFGRYCSRQCLNQALIHGTIIQPRRIDPT